MRERPILFSAPMVRAILAGAKTQTRRPVKGIALEWLGEDMFLPEYVAEEGNGLSPFGYPGDRLWVRETWAAVNWSTDFESGYADDVYGSEHIPKSSDHDGISAYWHPTYAADEGWDSDTEERGFRWRPSIHMPRWACRLVLEIVSVRVERLEDLTEADAKAEGFESRAAFLEAFRAIYKLSPDANPWVWVVEFKRVEASA